MDIRLKFIPRPWQSEVLKSKARFRSTVVRRRGGKTVLAIQKMINTGLRSMSDPILKARIAETIGNTKLIYLAPTYSMAKKIAWDVLKELTDELPTNKLVTKKYNESDLKFFYGTEHNNFTIYLAGADNPDALRGLTALHFVLDEYGDMKASTWGKVIQPMLLDFPDDVEVDFIGTPKGKNHFYHIHKKAATKEGWEAFTYDIYNSGLTDAQIETLREDVMDTGGLEAWQQEYECSFEPIVRGAIFGDHMRSLKESGRLGIFPVDNRAPVSTAWDLGVADDTAIILFQQVGKEIRIVGFLCDHGRGMDSYIDELNSYREKHGIAYDYHLAPHDIEVREFSNGKSRKQQAAELGFYFTTVPRCLKKADSIEAARKLLPRVWIDSSIDAQTEYLVEALQSYSYKYNDRLDIYSKSPLHDKFSNPADAFQTLASGIRDYSNMQEIEVFNASWDGNPCK